MIRLMGIGDTVEFELRLAEAIAWCVPRANAGDPRNSLRHDSWQPHILAEDRISIVSSIVGHRGTSTSRQTPRAVQSADDLHGGRLLVYFPDAELSDGAAELASNGFFDIHNTPPWDTWVGLFRNDGPADSSYETYLVAYVPAPLVKAASDGVECNPEECIQWLVNSKTRLLSHLKQKSLRIW